MLTIFSLIVLFFSIVLHEVAHGSVALQLGDPTAKNAGRLTLNPLKHIDLFGTIILPLVLILSGSQFVVGWAKPVPVNPFNFRDQKWGSLKVSIAGPATNFLIAVLFGLAIRFLPLPAGTLLLFGMIVIYNFAWGLFNLLPFPPLDGSHILFTFLEKGFDRLKIFLYQYHLFILIIFLLLGGLTLIFRLAEILFVLLTGQRLFI